MATIRVRMKLESDTLTLPELKQLIGKTVDIEVTEQPLPMSSEDRWKAAAEAAQQITDYDFNAASEQREFDRVQAEVESLGLLKWPGTVIGTLRREDMYDDVC